MSEVDEAPEGEGQERDYEAEARQLGWHPQDEFRGNAADWVDARTFITRGENALPIVRENNRKLAQRVRRSDDEIAALKSTVEDMNQSLSTLRKMAERADEAGYQRALADLKSQQRQAVRDGDEATFYKIEGEIAKVEATREEIIAAPAPKPPEAPKGPKATPEFKAWMERNQEWVMADPVLGTAAVKAELELRQSDEDLTEAEIWEGVTDTIKQKYPRRFAAATGTEQAASAAIAAQPRRSAGVLAPSGGAPSSSARKGGIAAILDPDERKAAQSAFASIRRSIPDYTEAEYMAVYVNPNADSIGPAIQRKVKANGSARAN